MKTPLRYQITEFDCGSVSLTNCITYLFNRSEIPAELIKIISAFTLDCYDECGNLGNKGTSREVVEYLTKWIKQYGENNHFCVDCEYLEKQDVTYDRIKECVKNGGCVNLRTYSAGVDHYVTITKVTQEYVYLFDPYYYPDKHYKNNKCIDFEFNPFKYNRKVVLKRFLSKTKQEFALGPVDKRECVLFNRNKC